MTRIKNQIIHFDTVNSNYNSITNSTMNSFNTNFKLAYTLRNVNKISLKSIEMPVGFYNGRISNTYLSFGILSSSPKPVSFNVPNKYTNTFTLNQSVLSNSAEQNFTSITDLITVINAYIVANWATYSVDLPPPVFSFNTSTNKVQLTVLLWFAYGDTVAATNYYKFVLNDSYLMNSVLGYNKNNVSVAQSTYYGAISINNGANPNISSSTYANSSMQQFVYTFNNPYSLFNDNYLNMTLSNLPVVTANANQKPCSFKIAFNSTGNTYFFSAENTSFIQSILLDNTNFVLDSLNVIITDRFGNAINSNGFDYSFSLEIESQS